MKWSLGISNFLEEISSLSHSTDFLYFCAMITEEGFLISPCYSLNSAFKWVYLSFSPLPFVSFLFSAICKASWDNLSWAPTLMTSNPDYPQGPSPKYHSMEARV